MSESGRSGQHHQRHLASVPLDGTPSPDEAELMRELVAGVNQARAVVHIQQAIESLEKAYEQQQKSIYWSAWEYLQQAHYELKEGGHPSGPNPGT